MSASDFQSDLFNPRLKAPEYQLSIRKASFATAAVSSAVLPLLSSCFSQVQSRMFRLGLKLNIQSTI